MSTPMSTPKRTKHVWVAEDSLRETIAALERENAALRELNHGAGIALASARNGNGQTAESIAREDAAIVRYENHRLREKNAALWEENAALREDKARGAS